MTLAARLSRSFAAIALFTAPSTIAPAPLPPPRPRHTTTRQHPPLKPQVHNEGGSKRVVVTKPLPGDRWLEILTAAGCRVEVSQCPDVIQDNATIKKLIGAKCDGVIGQLTEVGVYALRVCAAVRALLDLPLRLPLPLPLPAAAAHSSAYDPAATSQSCNNPLPQPQHGRRTRLGTPQDWGAELFEALRAAGGRAYSNYAVGYNNVKVCMDE